jgi:hypothetical protein
MKAHQIVSEAQMDGESAGLKRPNKLADVASEGMDFNSNGFRHGEQSASTGEQRKFAAFKIAFEVSSIDTRAATVFNS